MSGNDWSDDPAWTAFAEDFMEHGLPKIRRSDITMFLMTENPEDFDAKQAIEIGALLLLDKPIILLAVPGVTLSTRLARAADAILYDWVGDEDGMRRLQEAVQTIFPEGGDDEQS